MKEKETRSSFWNVLQKELRETIKKEDTFIRAKELMLSLHRLVHQKEVYGTLENTFLDDLYMDINDTNWAIMPTEKDVTIAWNLWHITRIEDIVTNILIAPSKQVLDTSISQLHTKVTDTGNAMSDQEIISLSQELDINALKEYRKAVGKRTREVLLSLTYQDMKRLSKVEEIQRIIDEKAVSLHSDAFWLISFWGKKNIAGLLLMPITRHQIGHINDSFALVKKIKNKNEYYLPKKRL
jgi:hypothetical protein